MVRHASLLLYMLPLIGPLARWTHVQLSVMAMAGSLYLIGRICSQTRYEDGAAIIQAVRNSHLEHLYLIYNRSVRYSDFENKNAALQESVSPNPIRDERLPRR